jgi:hypothetical protein
VFVVFRHFRRSFKHFRCVFSILDVILDVLLTFFYICWRYRHFCDVFRHFSNVIGVFDILVTLSAFRWRFFDLLVMLLTFFDILVTSLSFFDISLHFWDIFDVLPSRFRRFFDVFRFYCDVFLTFLWRPSTVSKLNLFRVVGLGRSGCGCWWNLCAARVLPLLIEVVVEKTQPSFDWKVTRHTLERLLTDRHLVDKCSIVDQFAFVQRTLSKPCQTNFV